MSEVKTEVKQDKKTILLYGRTRSGKSTQIGELAEYVYKTTGKRTRVYTIDKGGYDVLKPYIALGIIEVVEALSTSPWIFMDKAVNGYVRDLVGKWIKSTDPIGMYAFEGLTPFGDALMNDMAKKAGGGINIGGGANISFKESSDGETLTISGSNMAHYGVAQSRITDAVWQSQKLDAPYILWTASASKDEDINAGGKVIGPAMVGKALTAEIPRWFGLTFRLDATPAGNGKGEEHILYLGNNIDLGAGNAVGLGNTRAFMDADPLPQFIKPASVVKAIQLIEGGYDVALNKIKNRLAQQTTHTTVVNK